MKKELFILLVLLITNCLSAQFKPKSVQNNHITEPCGTDIMHKKMMESDSEYARKFNNSLKEINSYIEKNNLKSTSATIYKIPVVVHVIHTGGAIGTIYNPTDATITSMVTGLTNWFRNQGSVNNVNGVDIEIEFELAKRSPTCTTTTGINRVNGSSLANYTANGVNADNSTGAADAAVKSLSIWSNTEYYNIWLVNKIDGNDGTSGSFIAGYAYFPGAPANIDGTVMLATQIAPTSFVLPHEIGHALSLFHTFEDSTGIGVCASNTDCANQGDMVCDTAPHDANYFQCTANACSSDLTVLRNIMSYNCQDRFTAGQKTRMRAALETQRASLLSSAGGIALDSQSTATACTPTNTGNHSGIGVTRVQLANLNISSQGSLFDGANYIDRSCKHGVTLDAGSTNAIIIQTSINDHNIKVFIDYNNNGDFTDAGEQVISGSSSGSSPKTLTSNIVIPSTGILFNQSLRMRVVADFIGHASPTSCSLTLGQAEDFFVKIIPITCSIKTWTAGAWSPTGTPTTLNEVVINDTYNTSTHGNIESCKLTINTGKTLTIASDGHVLSVNEVINNGTITVENNGSIVQEDNSKINTGNVIYKRIAKARNSDYVYWSSPVANYTLSGHVATGPKYIWDTTAANANSTQGNWVSPPTTLGLAQGVIVRSTSNFSDLTTTINNFENIFTGVPNNGTINKTIYRGNLQNNNTVSGVVRTPIDDNHNLIGNPYPSAISAKTFLTLNSANLTGSLKIWTHGTLVGNNGQSFYQNFSNTYASSDYNSYNLTGSVFSPGLDYYIGAGQGFFVTMVDGASASNVDLLFNNTLRNKSYSNSSTSATPNFYRNNSNSQSQESKFWIDLVAENGASSRSLIGYVLGATNQKDNLHDGITKPQGSILLYSKLGEDRLDIQGKGLPFTVEDQVPMGYFAPTTGNYNLALAYVEGNFNNGQSIYVKDNLLNTYHNLSQNPYLFNTNAGEIQDRFLIVYQIPLNNENFDNEDISIYVNNFISIKSKENIESIEIFDVLGKQIRKYENLSTNNFQDDFMVSNGVYIVKIKTDKNKIISRKVIK